MRSPAASSLRIHKAHKENSDEPVKHRETGCAFFLSDVCVYQFS
jgi:hypothetical protein